MVLELKAGIQRRYDSKASYVRATIQSLYVLQPRCGRRVKGFVSRARGIRSRVAFQTKY